MSRDVAIVGASAAGLFTAARLARAGRRVRVVERNAAFPGARRTLIATARLSEELGPVTDGAVVNEVRTFELFADGKFATIELRKPDLVLERSRLLCDLADDAQRAGAEVLFAHRFVDVTREGGQMKLLARAPGRGGDRVWACDDLIGADGALSRVAQGAGWPRQTTVPLVQARVRTPDGMPRDTVRVWFRPEDTPYFYWLIPEEDGTGVLGLIGGTRRSVRPRLDTFLRAKGLRPLEYQAARIPLYTRWRPVRRPFVDGSVYLVGDAAGHVKPTTVGGLVTGFRGASAVVERMLGLGSRRIRSLRRELDRHLLVRRALNRFGEREYAKLIDLLGRPENALLGSYSRDDTHRLLWRLFAREPRIALVGALRVLGSRPLPPTES